MTSDLTMFGEGVEKSPYRLPHTFRYVFSEA